MKKINICNYSMKFRDYQNNTVNKIREMLSVGKSTLDEAPGAYKDSKIIEGAITPTATIIDKVKPIHNMKDGGLTFRKKGKK